MAIARSVDRRLFFLFDRAHTQLAKAAELHMDQGSGVTTAQAAVLIYLGYNDTCRLTDLADGIGRNNAAVTGLVSRMESVGLVKRKSGQSDGRSKKVCLTPLGWARREFVMDDFRIFNEKLVRNMSETEIEAVFKFLSQAVDNIK